MRGERSMKAVVTGGAGFIGSHLVEELRAQHADVHVIDMLAAGNDAYIPHGVHLHKVDINSKEAHRIIVKEQPDVVFHLAAQVSVQQSMQDPYTDADTNISGTIRVLQACKEASVKKVIFSSTAAVYGNLQRERIAEHSPIHPESYYGLSKWTAETYIRQFFHLHGLRYTILRYANVYGPRQLPKGDGGVVALFLNSILTDQPVCIYGDGQQTRDFIYVKDVAKANLAAIVRGHEETLHISTSNRISIYHLVEQLSLIHGAKIEIEYKKARAGDIRHSCLDNRKARKQLLWQPHYQIHEGLQEAYAANKTKRFSS
jgi:UDP-glucose 4-epimerase